MIVKLLALTLIALLGALPAYSDDTTLSISGLTDIGTTSNITLTLPDQTKGVGTCTVEPAGLASCNLNLSQSTINTSVYQPTFSAIEAPNVFEAQAIKKNGQLDFSVGQATGIGCPADGTEWAWIYVDYNSASGIQDISPDQTGFGINVWHTGNNSYCSPLGSTCTQSVANIDMLNLTPIQNPTSNPNQYYNASPIPAVCDSTTGIITLNGAGDHNGTIYTANVFNTNQGVIFYPTTNGKMIFGLQINPNNPLPNLSQEWVYNQGAATQKSVTGFEYFSAGGQFQNVPVFFTLQAPDPNFPNQVTLAGGEISDITNPSLPMVPGTGQSFTLQKNNNPAPGFVTGLLSDPTGKNEWIDTSDNSVHYNNLQCAVSYALQDPVGGTARDVMLCLALTNEVPGQSLGSTQLVAFILVSQSQQNLQGGQIVIPPPSPGNSCNNYVYTVTNPGSIAAINLVPSLTMGSNTPANTFSFSNSTCGSTLAAGSNCQLTLTFCPASDGCFTGTLAMDYDVQTTQTTTVHKKATHSVIAERGLTSQSIGPSSITLTAGTTEQLSMLGTFDDGIQRDISACTSGLSASQHTGVSDSGQITAGPPGTDTVTFTSPFSGVASESITVTSQPPGQSSNNPQPVQYIESSPTVSGPTSPFVSCALCSSPSAPPNCSSVCVPSDEAFVQVGNTVTMVANAGFQTPATQAPPTYPDGTVLCDCSMYSPVTWGNMWEYVSCIESCWVSGSAYAPQTSPNPSGGSVMYTSNTPGVNVSNSGSVQFTPAAQAGGADIVATYVPTGACAPPVGLVSQLGLGAGGAHTITVPAGMTMNNQVGAIADCTGASNGTQCLGNLVLGMVSSPSNTATTVASAIYLSPQGSHLNLGASDCPPGYSYIGQTADCDDLLSAGDENCSGDQIACVEWATDNWNNGGNYIDDIYISTEGLHTDSVSCLPGYTEIGWTTDCGNPTSDASNQHCKGRAVWCVHGVQTGPQEGSPNCTTENLVSQDTTLYINKVAGNVLSYNPSGGFANPLEFGDILPGTCYTDPKTGNQYGLTAIRNISTTPVTFCGVADMQNGQPVVGTGGQGCPVDTNGNPQASTAQGPFNFAPGAFTGPENDTGGLCGSTLNGRPFGQPAAYCYIPVAFCPTADGIFNDFLSVKTFDGTSVADMPISVRGAAGLQNVRIVRKDGIGRDEPISLPLVGQANQITVPFDLIATFADPTVPAKVVTDAAVWVSSDTSVAYFNASSLGDGVIAATYGGVTTVTAGLNYNPGSGTYQYSDSFSLFVNGPQLMDVYIAPPNGQGWVNLNQTLQLTAHGQYSTVPNDRVLSSNVTWTSDNTSVATVSSTGLVTGVAAGTANISISYTDGITATSSIPISVYSAPSISEIYPPVSGSSGPSAGPTTGGTAIKIYGVRFTPDSIVSIGGAAPASQTFVNSGEIDITTPQSPFGTGIESLANIVVTTPNGSATASPGFEYLLQPTITSISPSTGPQGGGTQVTITGTNFPGNPAVYYGGVPGNPSNPGSPFCGIVSASSTQIVCNTNASSIPGPVTITVYKVPGIPQVLYTSSTNGFTFAGPPSVTSVSPSVGPLAGGAVTINGYGFKSGATVTFGSQACTSPTVVSNTQITCTAPSVSSAGAVTITVTNSDQTSGTLSNGYTYYAAPTVTTINPNTGPDTGGTTVTIIGTGFYPGATATIDGVPCNLLTVNTVNQITCTTAAASNPGQGNVVVTIPQGNQSGTLTNGFTYTDVNSPVITAVTPSGGPTGGGTSVTITGSGFAQVQSVNFGNNACTNVSVTNRNTLTCTTPAGTAGYVNVTITKSAGSANLTGTLPNAFRYQGSPTLTSVSPASGYSTGGATLTLTGNGFESSATVFVGQYPCASVNVVSSSQITCTTPANPSAGAVNVKVTNNPSGYSSTLTNAFTYLGAPAITSISPAYGSAAGGNTVTITGSNYRTGAKVTIDGNAATNVSVGGNGTQITATVPAAPTDPRTNLPLGGPVTVIVTNTDDGESATSPGGYTYVSTPTITSVTPSQGAQTLTTQLTIQGQYFQSGITTVALHDPSGQNSDLSCGSIFVNTVGTTITCTAPSSVAAGARNVVVSNGGSSTASAANAFTYVAPPTITQISPAYGSPQGGTSVTITGTGFTNVTSVQFGGTDATSYTVNSSTQITATTAVHTLGKVDVTVTGGVGPQTARLSQGFNYSAQPTLTAVSPSAGPMAGGNTIKLGGSNFLVGSGQSVTVGGNSCTNLSVSSDATTLTCTVPKGTVNDGTSVDVVYSDPTNAYQTTLTLHSAYTYDYPPTITSMSPSTGPYSGGTVVTFTGTYMRSGATITFGNAACTNLTYTSLTQVSCTTPSVSAPESVTVTLTNPDGQSATTSYGYSPAPTVTSVVPSSATMSGAIQVQVNGSNFRSGATVTFGGTACTSITIDPSQSFLKCTVPSAPGGTAGPVDVVVSNTDTGSNPNSGTLHNGFTYDAAPTISSTSPVSPNSGGTTLNTAISITGTNFYAGTTATIGGVACLSPSVNAAGTVLTCNTPTSNTAGAVNVVVTQTSGQSATAANAFTYVAAPTLTAISPAAGPTGGNTTLTLTGTNFSSGMTVSVGGASCGTVNVASSTSATCVTGAGSSGTYNVTVSTNPGPQSATLSNAFAYAGLPTISSISPTTGPTAGGATLTVSGTNFRSTGGITVGGSACAITAQSSTSITCTTPSGTAGAADVVYTDSQNTTQLTVKDAGAYTYSGAPSLTAINPTQGGNNGQTLVTLTGANFVSGSTTVAIGGVSCGSVNVISQSQLTCVTGSSSNGTYNVVVTTGGGSATLTNGYTYVTPATVCDTGTDMNVAGDTCTVSSTVTLANNSAVAGAGNLEIKSGGSITCTAPCSLSYQIGGSMTVDSGGNTNSAISSLTANSLSVTGTMTGDITAANVPTVTVNSGGTIKGNLYNFQATSFTVASGGTVSADGLGYAGGTSSNNTGQGPGGGGVASSAAHGGAGGNATQGNSNGSTATYGSAAFPNEWGSGGGYGGWPNGNNGGAGGGIVWLRVSGTLTVNGTVSANGLSPVSAADPGGAGAGGSILVDLTNALNGGGGTGSVAGTGNFTAQGGAAGTGASCCSYNGGSGGGGRIAFYSTNKFQGTFSVAGGAVAANNADDPHGLGTPGAGGSFYQSLTNGLCDSGDLNGTDTCTISSVTAVGQNQGFPAAGGAQLAANIVVTPTGYLYTPGNGYGLNINTTGSVTLQSRTTAGVAASLGSATMSAGNVTVASGSSLNTASGLSATVANGGTFEVDGTVNSNIASLSAPTVTLNGTINGNLSNFSATTVTMNSGSAINGNVNWLNATNLTVASGATISATGKGYAYPSYGPGSGGQGVAPAHGGVGGNAGHNGPAGSSAIYGSLTWPTELGSGGVDNGYAEGSAGGGFVGLKVSGALTLSGTVSADGSVSNTTHYAYSGGGAGGSIIVDLITANGTATESGSGVLSAQGGAGALDGSCDGNYNSAGGGGGRIAWYGPAFPGTVKVNGGAGISGGCYNPSTSGGAGTYYTSTLPEAIVLSGPASLTAGVCSALYTLTTQDGFGNTLSVPSNTTVALSGGSASYYSDSGCTQRITGVSLATGQSQGSFYVMDTKAETVTVTATFASTSTSGTESVTVGPAAATALAITGPTTPVDTTCVAYTVTAVDQYGNSVPLASADTINLAATGNAKLYSNSGCTTSTSSVSIAQNASSATFYVDDTTAQGASLTATDSSGHLTQASESETFTPGPLSQIAIVGPASIFAGSCIPYTVTTEDSSGNASAPSQSLQIIVSGAADGFFYRDSACSAPQSSFSLAAGSSTFTVYYEDKLAELPTLMAQDSQALYRAVTEAVTVKAGTPAALAITGSPTVTTGNCAKYAVVAEDSYGNPSNVSSSTTVTLSGNGSGTFYTDSACSSQVSGGVAIASGLSSQNFYFKDTTVENLTFAGSAGVGSGMTNASYAVSVRSGLPVKLVLSGPATLGPGQCGAYTLKSEDNSSNLSAPGTSFTAGFVGGSGTYYADQACTQPYPASAITMTPSTSSVTFGYSDSTVESFTMLASGGGLTPGALSVAVAVAPVLTSVPNYTYPSNPLVQGVPFTVDINNIQGGSPGNDVGMSYTCVYDQVIDGVVSPGTSCAQLPGTPATTFNASTGVLNWTPSSSALGPYEIKVTGTAGAASASTIFAVDVRPPYPLANLIANYDVWFENTTGPLTSGSSTKWTDISGNGFNGTLSGDAPTGFTGSGTAASPYAINFDGSASASFGSSLLSGNTKWLFTSWINPAASPTGGTVVLGNNTSGSGLTLRESLTHSGQLELVAGTPYQDTMLALGPAGYWRLDECGPSTAADISGNGHTGTYQNGTSCQSTLLTGDNDGATGFNGNGSQVTIPFNLSSTTDHSLTAWFKGTNDSGSLMYREVIDTRGGSSDTPARMLTRTNNGTLTFQCTMEIPSGVYTTGELTINLNQTYFGACTYVASTRVLTAYLNGSSVGSVSVTAGTDSSTSTLMIGNDPTVSTETFWGTIDEVAVFNKALTAANITSLWNAGSGTTGASCLQSEVSSSGAWSFLAGLYDNASLSLFFNGKTECSVPAPSGLATSSAGLYAATSTGGTNDWKGQIADLKVYGTSNGTSPGSAKTVFDATADRYRPVPVGNIALNGLALNLDAANYSTGVGFPGTGCGSPWFDLSPFSTSGSLINFDTCGTYGFQGSGTPSSPYALVFDGNDDYVTLGSWPGTSWTNGITVEVWANPSGNASWARFVDLANGAPSDNIMLARNGTSSTLHWQTFQGTYAGTIEAANAIVNNAWNHYVGTVDQNGNGTLYVDGNVVATGSMLLPKNVTRNNSWIGRSQWNDAYYGGSMAVVRIYSRALANWEVSQNCNAVAGRFNGVSCNYVPAPAGVSQLAFTGTGAAASGCTALTLTAKNASGVATAVSSDTTVNLTSTGSGHFYSSSSCSGSAVTSTIIPSGASSATVYFEDTAAETASVMASTGEVTSGAYNVTSYSTSSARTPVLSAVSNYTFPNAEMMQGSTLTVDFNNVAYGSPGFDTGMTYTCVFDQVPDGTVNPGTSCTQLPSYPAATFNTSTGILTFTPSGGAFGPYEIKVTGTNSNGSGSQIFVVDVRPTYPLANLRLDLDASFSTPSGPVLSGTPSTWFDLSPFSFNGSLLGSAPNKWGGSGTAASPYSLTLDGAGQMTFASGLTSAETKILFSTWIAPSSVSTAGSVILSDGGGSGAGFALKQSAVSAGRVELDIGNSTYPNVVVADNPVGYWRLTEASGTTASDSSGSGNSGTYQGSVTLGAAGPSVASPDTAVTLSGSEYISLNGTGLPIGSTSYTLSAWIKPASMATYGIVGWGNYGTNNQVNALKLTSTGVVNQWWNQDLSATANLADGNWHHVLAEWNGTSRSLWVDGVLANTDTPSGLAAASANFGIGLGNPGNSEYFQGSIAQVAVFNQALSAAQIRALAFGGLCVSNSVLANNVWNEVGGLFDGTYASLYVNGRQECQVPVGSLAVQPSTTSLSVGAISGGTSYWKGALADLKVYETGDGSSVGTSSTVKTLFDATADRFRSSPAGGVVRGGLVTDLDAASAVRGLAFPGTGCSVTDWFDLSPSALDATVLGFGSCASTTGWKGSGTPTDPYRLAFDGSASYATIPAAATAGLTQFTIGVWFRTSSTASNGTYWQQPSIINQGTPNPASGDFGITVNNGYLAMWTGLNSPNDLYQQSTTLVNDNNWHYVVAVNNGTMTNVYLDGSPLSLSLNSGLALDNWGFGIGACNLQGGSTLGFLQEDVAAVHIYNRPLAEWEISQNCAAMQSRLSGANCAYTAPTASSVTQLAFSGASGAIPGGCSAYTVTAENASGVATPVSADTQVALTGAGHGAFYAASSCSGQTVNSVVIPAGQSSATVYYADSTAETVTLAANVTGITSGAKTVTEEGSATPVIARAPSSTLPDMGLTAGQNFTFDFTNTAYGIPGVTVGMSFTCYWDQVVDGQVTTVNPCTSLPGATSSTFNTSTGVLNWTPNNAASGPYEIKVTGNDQYGSASEIIVIDVKPAYSATNLLGDWEAQFASGTAMYSGANSAWIDLSGNNYTGTTSDPVHAAWAGNGTVATPYACAFDGSGNVDYGSSVLSSATEVMFQAWVEPTNATTAGSVILSDGGGSAKGFVLRQAKDGSGRVELSTGTVDSSYATLVESLSPVGYWRLNESSGTTAADSSGSNNNGTYTGGYTLGSTSPPRTTDTSVNLNGSSGYVSVPTSTSLNTTQKITLAAWIYPSTTNGEPILEFNNGSNVGVHFWQWSNTTSQEGSTLWADFIDTSGNNHEVISGGGIVTQNAWSHVAAVYDGSISSGTNAWVYLNGTLVATGALGSNTLQTSYPLNIGRRPSGSPNYWFTGNLAQAAVFNKALSQAQINELYAAGLCISQSTMSNNQWNFVAGLLDGTNVNLFLNGQLECQVPMGSYAFQPPTTDLAAGATASKANGWTGDLADLEVYGTTNGTAPATATTVKANFDASAERFRATPIQGIATTGLVVNLDAANALHGLQFPGSGCSPASWFDLSTFATNGILNNYGDDNCGVNGWQGNGTPSNPYALWFDGNNDYVSLGSSWAGTSWTNGISVEVWAYPTSTGSWARFTDIGNGTPSDNILLARNGTSSTVRWQTCNGGTCNNLLDTANVLTSLNTWYHIVGTLDGSGNSALYVDGAKVNSGTGMTIPSNVVRNNPWIGQSQWGGDAHYQGAMAIVRIYNRALSQSEVSGNCKTVVNRFTGVTCH